MKILFILKKSILILIFITIFNTNGFSQLKQIKIDFIKEVKQCDTCIRFFKIENFNNKNKEHWYILLEHLYNIVLILPNDKNWSKIDDSTKNDSYYTSSCINVIFYFIDGKTDISSLSIDNFIKNDFIKKKVICKYYYSNDKLIVDPFSYKIYSQKNN